jgi:Cys-rich repeat protein
VKCYDKSHCKAGEVCRTNVCVTGCDIDADCSGGWKCKKTGNGVCVECLESADCPYGEKCAGNVCVAGGCSSDTECLNGYFCHPKLRTCEPLPPSPCKTNGDCNVIINTKICDPLTRTCIPVCYYVAGFPICLDSARPYCDTSYNGCYECIADSNCDGTDCKDLNNTCVKCAIDFDCKNPAWHCDGISGACYECVNNTHCAPNFCDISNHKCVQCFQNTDCKNPSFPICGKDKTCIPPCTDDCVKDAMKCDPTDSTHETYMTCGDYDNDPCMEWSYSKYCPSHQYCYQSKCICKPAPCSEGQYGCDAQYPTTVYQCTKDSNGCLYWATYMTCTNGSKCGQSGCP